LNAIRLLAGLGTLASIAVGATACSTGAPAPWQKPGADQQTIDRDTASCRTAAQAEAMRRYPYSAGSVGLGAAGIVAAQQSDSTDRAVVEAGRFNDCMAERGYRRG
jgi:hypothetical protein